MGDKEDNTSGIKNFKDMEVYKRLTKLNQEVYEITLTFPDFEKYELGSQLRRAANSAPANFAEGWNNKHINIYIEGINRSMGEIRETEHHLLAAFQRKYILKEKFEYYIGEYNICGRMLKNLERSLGEWKDKNLKQKRPL